MNKEFIPYEQALALKELGFDEPCFGYYHIISKSITQWTETCDFRGITNSDIDEGFITTPLYQQALRWFREKYGLISFILPFALLENNGLWCYEITDFSNNWDESSDIHSPEEAELECLKKLIEIVKTNKQN